MHSLVKKKTASKEERVKKLGLLVTLLTYGGDVDIDKATSAGETALHIATKVGELYCNIIMVRCHLF